MTLKEAIDVRVSRRKYTAHDLEQKQITKLQKLIDEYNRIDGFRIELVLKNGDVFAGFTRSYGMLSGVQHYFGFIADVDDEHADEKIGYYGELLVLHATTLGLGTCWIGGTFSKSKTPFKLTEKERLSCLITVGHVKQEYSFKEKLIHNLSHRRTKSVNEMYVSDTTVPDWFLTGMEAVKKAPSAMNKQPVIFHYHAGKIWVEVNAQTKYFVGLDLGIAKLHFELGAGGSWEWGNKGQFVYEQDSELGK